MSLLYRHVFTLTLTEVHSIPTIFLHRLRIQILRAKTKIDIKLTTATFFDIIL